MNKKLLMLMFIKTNLNNYKLLYFKYNIINTYNFFTHLPHENLPALQNVLFISLHSAAPERFRGIYQRKQNILHNCQLLSFFPTRKT